MYARVVVDTGATSQIDALTYEIPDSLAGKIRTGSCVLVPLASRQAVGYVIGFEEKPSVEKTRPIISELDGPIYLSKEVLRLARWISAQYMCSLPRVILGMLPGVMHCKVQTRFSIEESLEVEPKLTPSESELFQLIQNYAGDPTVEALCDSENRAVVLRLLRQLESKGVIRRVSQLLLPGGKVRIMQGVQVNGSIVIDDKLYSSLSPKQEQAMRVISGLERAVSFVELAQQHGISQSRVSVLERKGLLQRTDVVVRRDVSFVNIEHKPVVLSEEQQTAVNEITSAISANEYTGYLLYGVTASGKTEVYLRCIEHALAQGKTSLILLPEIALTTQVMNIFKSRLGDKVAVLHSALSAGERCDEWRRINDGEAKVVLGARSAVFAPLTNLGFVVVDEEHESSYKQDNPPRYNGRNVARQRAKDANAVLVLGSATPSIESYFAAEQGHYKLLTIANRVAGRPMPKVLIADLREEYKTGKATIFSTLLEEGIRVRLSRGEQVILLQNRRAYSTFLLCRDCGFVMRCPNCSVSLKFHSAEKKLSCHHCKYEQPAPTLCPSCNGLRIGRFGIGTERVEEETRNTFPEARVMRMDRDTTARKGAHGTILEAFRQGEADILVGTQMIAKGLDFPNVTLVGVVSADTSINLPDFRAAERTFQLISQVAGRSGRGQEPGEVIVQTFDPDQYAIQCAAGHDYLNFYKTEIETRGELNYPPYTTIINIVSSDAQIRSAESRLTQLLAVIKSVPTFKQAGITIDGPIPAVLSRLRGEFRWHLFIRSADREGMLSVVREALEKVPNIRKYLSVDVDPVSML